MCRTCGCSGEVHVHHAHPHMHAHTHAHPHQHDHDHDHAHDHDHDHAHERRRVAIEANLLAKNDRLAGDVRARLAERGIAAVNLIGAPGAGKTALLEHTLRALGDVPIAVLEGDQATDHDARRIAETGRPVVQINTDAGCHLDATMVDGALGALDMAAHSLLFIENVGNLVCPALFDVGEQAKVVVMSVTEGEDKPLKYPHVFRAASALVLTKADLVPHVGVDPARYAANARAVNPTIEVFVVSATRGIGLGPWCSWLRAQLAEVT